MLSLPFGLYARQIGSDKMTKYIVKRVALGLLSVFIVATLTFFLMNLVPGGPFVAEKSISKAAQEALAAKYGLDKPLGQQYLTYMTDLLHGDMGVSLRQRGRTVSDIPVSLTGLFGAGDHVVLQRFVQVREVPGEAADPDAQIPMLVGVLLRVKKLLPRDVI